MFIQTNKNMTEYIEKKRTMIDTITKKNIDGQILEVIETKYTKYNYFTLSIKAEKNEKGELKKKCIFPPDWTNITQKYKKGHNGIALICGRDSGIYVVDYDDKTQFLKDSAYFPELRNHYLENRKGFHSYFKWNPEVQIKLGSTSNKEQNIDFQGEKRCVFTEPTCYTDEDGNEYKYKYLHEEPLQEMSKKLIEFCLINYIKKTNHPIIQEIDITPILNEMFKVNLNWNYEETGDCYKITHDGYSCLKNDIQHLTLNHSCLFVNKKSVTACCFSCKNKKLFIKDYPQIKQLKILLGLVEEKTSEDNTNNDFECLLYYMLEKAEEKKYKKENGFILKVITGVESHSEIYKNYNNFIDELFQDKEEKFYRTFRRKATHKDALTSYLEKNNDLELPFIERNHFIYSFNNGYLNIENMEFLEHSDKVCTTLYIEQDFNLNLETPFEEIKTPYLDKLIKFHIKDEEVYNILLAFIGRLFFPIGKLDNWQCMLFLRGQGNTGKSTLIEIIQSLFLINDLGIMEGNIEKTFGLQKLHDKRIIVSSDIPANLNEKIDATTFQKMVSGEMVSVPQKNRDPVFVKWSAPLLWAGNFLPDYSDKSGSISRRIAIFDMAKRVEKKDASLKQKILKERPEILVKCVKAYYHYIKKFGDVVFEDWGKKFNIKYFDKAREELKTENDILYAFLVAAPHSNKTKTTDIWIEYKEGAITTLDVFKKTFKAYARFKHEKPNYRWSSTSDVATLENNGYIIKNEHICASCGMKAVKDCCENFSRNNRRKKMVIVNMILRGREEESEDDLKIYENIADSF